MLAGISHEFTAHACVPLREIKPLFALIFEQHILVPTNRQKLLSVETHWEASVTDLDAFICASAWIYVDDLLIFPSIYCALVRAGV